MLYVYAVLYMSIGKLPCSMLRPSYSVLHPTYVLIDPAQVPVLRWTGAAAAEWAEL